MARYLTMTGCAPFLALGTVWPAAAQPTCTPTCEGPALQLRSASAQSVSAGDDAAIAIGSNSSCVDMSFMIKITRTLA